MTGMKPCIPSKRWWWSIYRVPLYVVFVRFISLVWSLYSVSFGHDRNVTLNVAFTPRRDVIGVGQQSPLVVKLMIYKTNKKTISLKTSITDSSNQIRSCFDWFFTGLGVDGANVQFERSNQCSTAQKIFGVNHLMGWDRETNSEKLKMPFFGHFLILILLLLFFAFLDYNF